MLDALKSFGSWRSLVPFRILRPAAPAIPEGCLPMGMFQADDIFLAGYPKSGNTWLQLAIACLVHDLDPQTTPDTLVQEMVPDIHYKKFYRRSRSLMVFKTHALPRPEYRRVINVVRDGRDVMCSLYHFRAALGRRVELDRLIDHGETMGFGTWHDHVTAWAANPYQADVLRVRYEDLIDDCAGELARIAGFLGLAVPSERLEAIASGTTVDCMQDREKRLGWDNRAWPKDKPFIRQGRKRGFERELSAEQINRFTAKAGEALALLGYVREDWRETNALSQMHRLPRHSLEARWQRRLQRLHRHAGDLVGRFRKRAA